MNVGARLDFGGRSLKEQFAVVHHEDSIAERHDEIHIVLHNDHDTVGRTQFCKLGRQFGRLVVIEARSWFVKQKHSRIDHQRASNLQHALAAIGQASCLGIGISLQIEEG